MQQPTQITVFLQALGAHFLGANAYRREDIKVKLVYSGGTVNLPYAFPQNVNAPPNDGINETAFSSGVSSFMPIITVPPSTQPAVLHFLNPNAGTICATANFLLSNAIELAHLDIHIPTTTSNNPLSIKYPVLLNPQRSTYNITVAIPGLYLSAHQMDGHASVLVKMMCGCPITAINQTPPSLWHPNDFTVLATVYDTSGGVTNYSLSYMLTNNTQTPNSLFAAKIPQQQNQIKHITYSALQTSTNNYGILSVPQQ